MALRKALLKQPEMFVRTLTEKLMTYGLGRGLEYTRHAARPRDRARRGDSRTTGSRRIVLGIVKSAPFQMKKAQIRQQPDSRRSVASERSVRL